MLKLSHSAWTDHVKAFFETVAFIPNLTWGRINRIMPVIAKLTKIWNFFYNVALLFRVVSLIIAFEIKVSYLQVSLVLWNSLCFYAQVSDNTSSAYSRLANIVRVKFFGAIIFCLNKSLSKTISSKATEITGHSNDPEWPSGPLLGGSCSATAASVCFAYSAYFLAT